jgi:hypothetical protein
MPATTYSPTHFRVQYNGRVHYEAVGPRKENGMTPEELNQAIYNLDVERSASEQKNAEADRTLEREKLELERNKVKWTALSILGSVAVAGITILGSASLQNSSANAQLRLKAAELVLQSDDPEVNKNKAERFKQLFPSIMAPHWAENFDWESYATENDDMKTEFAKLLAEHQDAKQRKKIIETYRALFKKDHTVQDFLDRLPGGEAQDPNTKKANTQP